MSKYKLREPLAAVQGVPRGGMRLITIPAGTVLELPENTGRFGIIEVMWGGQRTGVVLRDFYARADLIESATAS